MQIKNILLGLSLYLLPVFLFADGGIEDAYIIIELDGSTQYIQASSFDGYVFDNPSSLILKGGQNKVWKNGSTDIYTGWIYYRIYPCLGTPSDFVQSQDFSWVSNYTDDNGTVHQTWERNDQSEDLLANLQPGIYTFEVYFAAKATDDNGSTFYNLYYSNYGNNFKAQVVIYNQSITSGNWSDEATWKFSAPASAEPVLINSGHTVVLDADAAVSKLRINGSLQLGSHKLSFNQTCPQVECFLQNNGTFSADASTVIFNSFTAVSGNITFNNVELNAGVDFGANAAIDSVLHIKSGGYLSNNPIVYKTGSTLLYDTQGSYSRSKEWPDNTSVSQDVPGVVRIASGTSLDLNSLNTVYAGGLTIENSAALQMTSSSTKPLIIRGDVVIDGKLIFSQEVGGDLKLTGDLIKTQNGSIDWGGDATDKGRAVFCVGQDTQKISGVDTIPYFIADSAAHVVLQNDLVINGNGTQFLSLFYDAVLDLNGFSLISLATGNIDVDGANGALAKRITGKSDSRIVFKGSSNGVVNQINGGKLLLDSNVTIAVEGGTLDFGSSATDLYGTVEIRGQASIANSHYPVYHKGSTLKYVNVDDVVTGGEWPTENDSVEICIASADYKKVSLNEDKTIKGILTIKSGKLDLNGYSLNYALGSTLNYVLPADTTYVIADTCAQEWQETQTVPDNVKISQGTILLSATRTIDNKLQLDTSTTLKIAPTAGQLTVYDTIEIKPNASLILLGDSSSAASGSLITPEVIINNGKMIAERFIYAKHFSLLTPPNLVTQATLFNNNPNGTYNPNLYYYDESFDAVPDPDSEDYQEWYDTSNHYTQAWKSAQGTLNIPGRGYAYFNDTDRMLSYIGTFLAKDQQVTLSSHYNDANNGYFDGWNLIANPFTCALDWDSPAWDKTALYDAVYYWDAQDGNYKYYSSSGNYDDGSNSVNGGSRYIPAMQGFWVKVKDGYDNTNFTIPAAARAHSAQTFWTKSLPKNHTQYIKLQVSTETHSDETVIRFIESAKSGFDQYDLYKRFSTTEELAQIYTFVPGTKAALAINSLPADKLNDTLTVGLKINNYKRTVKLELLNNTIAEHHIILENPQNGTKTNLLRYGSIDFTPDSANYKNDTTFLLYFQQNSAPKLREQLPDLTYSIGQKIDLRLNGSVFYDENFQDSLGLTISIDSLPQWLKLDKDQLWLYGICQSADTLSIRLTATDLFGDSTSTSFKIIITDRYAYEGDEKLEIYPNPARDFIMLNNVQMMQVQIIDQSGRIIDETVINPFGSIYVGKLPEGVYYLKVQRKNGVQTLKFVKK